MTLKTMKIYLLRHATPQWDRTDIPYDIPPGPPLSPQGEKEAEALARFVQGQGAVKLYYSPFERAASTARIISLRNGIPCVEDERLAEWNEADEPGTLVRQRMASIFAEVAKESAATGPIGLVTHAGPVTFLLQELKIDPDVLARHRQMFDGPNPLPPAGAWKAEADGAGEGWKLNLEFVPASATHVPKGYPKGHTCCAIADVPDGDFPHKLRGGQVKSPRAKGS